MHFAAAWADIPALAGGTASLLTCGNTILRIFIAQLDFPISVSYTHLTLPTT